MARRVNRGSFRRGELIAGIFVCPEKLIFLSSSRITRGIFNFRLRRRPPAPGLLQQKYEQLVGGKGQRLPIDIDPRNGGNESLQKLLDEFGELPPTHTVATGGGGRHFYFRFPVGATEKLAGKLGDGIDIKSNGGYIVAPPSTRASGGAYRIANDTEPAELTGWLLECLTQKNKLPRDPKLSVANKSELEHQPPSTRFGGGFGKIYVEGETENCSTSAARCAGAARRRRR